MASQDRRGTEIAVIGAGIGGLCAARAIQLAGYRPRLIERNPETAVGAALALWPNAILALDRLGCGDTVRDAGMPVRRVLISSSSGARLSELDVDAVARRAGAQMVLIERRLLHELVAAGLEEPRLATVSEVEDQRVKLEGGESISAAAVIGADGVGSVARRYVNREATVEDAGYTAIRGIADHALGDGLACEAWGSNELIGAAALPDSRTYWFYEAPSTHIDPADPLAAVRRTRWPEPWPEIVSSTDADGLLVHAIRTVTPLRSWTRGHVTVLGDAAHAMEPNLGQGAAQAIEDAAALLAALRAHDDLGAALRAYANARQSRATMVQRESARAAGLALSRHTLARNLLVRAVPDVVRSMMIGRLLG